MMGAIKHILLVDDTEDHNFLNTIIISDTGLFESVHSVNSANDALEYLKKASDEVSSSMVMPDLLLLDINMPVMDGWDFLEQMQYVKYDLKWVPKIYMLSTSSYNRDIEKSKTYPLVQGFITKPLNEGTLKKIHDGEPI